MKSFLVIRSFKPNLNQIKNSQREQNFHSYILQNYPISNSINNNYNNN